MMMWKARPEAKPRQVPATHTSTEQGFRQRLTITKRSLAVTLVACCAAAAVLLSLGIPLHQRQHGRYLSFPGLDQLSFVANDWARFESGSDQDVETEILKAEVQGNDSESIAHEGGELAKWRGEEASATEVDEDPLRCGLWGTDRTLEPKARAHIRHALKLPPGVPALTQEQREELGAPCSDRWRRLVSGHFRRMKWKSKILVVTASLDRVCGPIDALKRFIEEGDDAAEGPTAVSPGPLSVSVDRLASSAPDSRFQGGGEGATAPSPSSANCVDDEAVAPYPPLPPIPPLNPSVYFPRNPGRSFRAFIRPRRAASPFLLQSPPPSATLTLPAGAQPPAPGLPAGSVTRRALVQVEALGMGKSSLSSSSSQGYTGAGLAYPSGRRRLKGEVWRWRAKGRWVTKRRGGRRESGRKSERGGKEEVAADAKEAEIDHTGFGDCWPSQVPCSPGVQRHLGDLVRSARRNASERPSYGGVSWRFLVFAFNQEQLSKAKIHLAEAARLAKATNRILVLPRVGASRLSLGRPLPLCRYFNLRQLTAMGVEWVSPDLFLLLYAHYISRRPLITYLCLDVISRRRCNSFRDVMTMFEDILAFSYGQTISWKNAASLNVPWSPQLPESLAVNILENRKHIDIIVYIKTSPGILTTKHSLGSRVLAQVMLPYAPRLQAMAQALAARLPSPYVALHFRSEFIVFHLGYAHKAGEVVARMSGCTGNAIALTKRMVRRIRAKAIFIASDVPWEGGEATASGVSSPDETQGGGDNNRTSKTSTGSNTWEASSPPNAPSWGVPHWGSAKNQRSESWGAMVAKFGEEKSIGAAQESLRRLRAELPGSIMLEELDPRIALMDSGEVGILDKLICAQASVFLAGKRNCGGTQFFDRDIGYLRDGFRKPGRTTRRWSMDRSKQ